MPAEALEFFTSGHVPELYLTALPAARTQEFTVVGEGEGVNAVFMANKAPNLFTAVGVPEPDQVVAAPRGKGLAIGGERDSTRRPGVPPAQCPEAGEGPFR